MLMYHCFILLFAIFYLYEIGYCQKPYIKNLQLLTCFVKKKLMYTVEKHFLKQIHIGTFKFHLR